MSRTQLITSRTIWRRKLAYRQARLAIARRAGHRDRLVTNVEADRIHKWERLVDEAVAKIAGRDKAIAALKPKPDARQRIVLVAEQAAANYRRSPGAYHYLAGGIPNTIIMSPTPSTYRSDCSQFVVACYKIAGVKCPGSGTYLYSNTDTINNGGRITTNPRPGDLGMYGRRNGSTHHVELYIGNGRHIGHGSRPIDSITPGRPDYYLTFLP